MYGGARGRRCGGRAGSVVSSLGAEVGQFAIPPIAPHVLHRVQFRRIGGRIFQANPALERKLVVQHHAAATRWQPVPHHTLTIKRPRWISLLYNRIVVRVTVPYPAKVIM